MLEIRSRSVPISDASVVVIKTKASVPLIANILSNTKAREIQCSSAIASTIPEKARVALDKMGIRVKIVRLKRGRPHKHAKSARLGVMKMLSSGVSRKLVSERIGIPLRTVYHIEKKG